MFFILSNITNTNKILNQNFDLVFSYRYREDYIKGLNYKIDVSKFNIHQITYKFSDLIKTIINLAKEG